MFKKIKDWLIDNNDYDEEYGNENFDEESQYARVIDLVRFNVNDMNQVEEVGRVLKEGKIVLLEVKDNILVRVLDFASGAAYMLNYKHIKITENSYLLVPSFVNYISNS